MRHLIVDKFRYVAATKANMASIAKLAMQLCTPKNNKKFQRLQSLFCALSLHKTINKLIQFKVSL